jgi:voltage-gated sodium channel
MSSFFKTIRDSNLFVGFILFVIVLAGVIVGIETYEDFARQHHFILSILDTAVLWIFVVEIGIKLLAEGKKPWNYFKDPWNVFDFSVVAVSFLPIGASYIAVLRLARILRAFRLVSALPKLQILVNALLKSIPSMGYVFILLSLHFYIYAVMGTFLFSQNDPMHFENLQVSILTLFRAVTLEDWTDLMYINMYGCDQYGYADARLPCTSPQAMPLVSVFYFVSFILTGAMIVLNLFIGVVINSMEEAQGDEEMSAIIKKKETDNVQLHEEIVLLENQIDELKKSLSVLNKRLQKI